MNNQRNFKKQKDNYLLAEDVYTVTMERYREGIASMTEVLQDEMQMSEAQKQLYQCTLQLPGNNPAAVEADRTN